MGEHPSVRYADLRACAEPWERLSNDVSLGRASWAEVRIDLLDVRAARAAALALNQPDVARQLFEPTVEGAYFSAATQLGKAAGELDRNAARDRLATASAQLAAHVATLKDYMSHWGMECSWSTASFELMARGVGMLLLRDDECAVAAAHVDEWLPSAGELVNIAKTERAWDVFLSGAHHPTLAGALVLARLGRWDDARLICDRLLELLVQPLTRIEALHARARCAAAEGDVATEDRCLQQAASEAAAAGYLELRKLLDGKLSAS